TVSSRRSSSASNPGLTRSTRPWRSTTSSAVSADAAASSVTGMRAPRLSACRASRHVRDVTIAQLLKGQGYATAQFGKNHLGDRNEHLPTVHGFDEFYGALYHLNASEEPELPDYPKAADFPNFFARFGPRGVLDCKASDNDDTTVDPRFGKVGKQ